MKFLPILLFVASGVVISCQNNAESGIEQNGSDTTVTGLEGTRDQQGQLSEVKIDTTSGQGAAGGSSDSLVTKSSSDAEFITEQVAGNYNEIALAKLALKSSVDKEIKGIAQQLIADHNKALEKLKSMASDLKTDVSNSPSGDGTKLLSSLEKRKGADFDKAWIEVLIDKHKTSISKYEAATNLVTDKDLKAFVGENLPKLRMHLDKLMAYHGQVK
jgi:putative membrane protein